MAIGQAAGTAAHLAIADEMQPRSVDVTQLQRHLLRQGQIITYFKDIERNGSAHEALQFLGTRGFFPTYLADAEKPLDRRQAAEWLKLLPEPLPVADDIDWSLKTPLTRRDLQRLFPTMADSNRPTARDENPVSRGLFCRLLYERLNSGKK